MEILYRNIDLSGYHEFCNRLQNQLNGRLPGKEAQLKMSSRVRLEELGLSDDTINAQLSSVLILLYFDQNTIRIPFILRPKYDGVHSGQVSFPGGRRELDDISSIDTAIREAHEEVNIKPDNIKVLGTLSDMYIPPSNFLVTPVLACCESKPDFIPQVSEVDEIIEADISFLFDESIKKFKTIQVRNTEVQAPYYDVNGHSIWGATAMMLSELEEVIKSIA